MILDDSARRLKLPAKFLSALRKDVQQARKSLSKSSKTNNRGEAVPTAILPDLVDIVDHEGAPAFLLLAEHGFGITPQVGQDGVLYVPPPKEQIPWLLPRGEEVLKWFSKKEPPGILYDDVLAHHKGISELPGEAYYDLLTAWVFHTYLLESCQHSPAKDPQPTKKGLTVSPTLWTQWKRP